MRSRPNQLSPHHLKNNKIIKIKLFALVFYDVIVDEAEAELTITSYHLFCPTIWVILKQLDPSPSRATGQ